jgi:hypothetical protein
LTTLVLLMRPECGLCESMLAQLEALRAEYPLPPIQVVNVDSDPELQRRYGLKIPVLMMERVPICAVRLDRQELLRALRT